MLTNKMTLACVLVCYQSLVTWDGDKLVCVQKGEKENRGWKQWLEGDLLHLVRESVTCWFKSWYRVVKGLGACRFGLSCWPQSKHHKNEQIDSLFLSLT